MVTYTSTRRWSIPEEKGVYDSLIARDQLHPEEEMLPAFPCMGLVEVGGKHVLTRQYGGGGGPGGGVGQK